jgi:hypothetical protein
MIQGLDYFFSRSYIGYYTYPEGRGGRTTPAHMYVDLSIEKDFVLPGRFVIALSLNVYNLFNSQRPISFIKGDADLFGQVWGRQMPCWLQLKAALRF